MPAKAFAPSASAAAANKDAALAKLQELLGRANSHELLDTLGTLVSSYVADAKDRIRKASVILKVVREKKIGHGQSQTDLHYERRNDCTHAKLVLPTISLEAFQMHS